MFHAKHRRLHFLRKPIASAVAINYCAESHLFASAMFRVKHRDKSPKEPAQVAEETIALVERELREVGFAIPVNLLSKLERFAAALALWGSKTNLTAAPDDPAELAFHILDSLSPVLLPEQPRGAKLVGIFGPGRRVLDLGSGAGFPGLVLAAATEANFTLLEARRKRASFLTVAASEMSLANVEVDSHHRGPEALLASFDVVTARAFAQPEVFYQSAVAALKAHGIAILYANPDQPLDQAAAAAVGFGETEQLSYAVTRGKSRVPRLLVVSRKR